MAKTKTKTKKKIESAVMLPALDECCDFTESDYSGCHDSSCDSSLGMEALIQADNFQTSLALDLTKLIVDNTSAENKTAEYIINCFTLSSKVIRENSALNALLEE